MKLVLLDQKEVKEIRESTVLLDTLVTLDLKVQLEVPEIVDQLEPLDQEAALVSKETKVRLVALL